MEKKALLMHEKDQVATVLAESFSGDVVQILLDGAVSCQTMATQHIDCYHKIAIRNIPKGAEIFKYGEIIGKATCNIKAGEHVHVNNIESVMVL